ncbi:MAG: peptidoglycan editing factor PgeF [Trueperaceae bacterium]
MELLKGALTVPHGFTTRQGGVSGSYYSSLNLGLSTGDEAALVEQNRERVLEHFGVTRLEISVLEQVHGNTVVVAEPSWHKYKADAHITDDSNLLLVIGMADCLPILFHDPVKHVVGAAHAGWRGTVQKVSSGVIDMMGQVYGSGPQDIRVVFGPAICRENYQVGEEVFQAFAEAGFPETIFDPDGERYRLDLVVANQVVLEQAGVQRGNMENLKHCTFADPTLFYSHRRDGQKRGSHWAAIKLLS